MNKEIKKEDYKNNKVKKEDFNVLVNSFKNYLDFIDENNNVTEKDKDKDWTIKRLTKIENNLIRECKLIISGEGMAIDNKGNMSSYNSTNKIIFTLIDKVNDIIILRKKMKEISL